MNREVLQQDIAIFPSLAALENNFLLAVSRLGHPRLSFRNMNWHFYVQNDWKVSPRLTLNLGLRYEYNSVWSEVSDRVSNFDFANQKLLPSGEPLYKPDRNNFAPRVGFAYDPFGKGKTVIRAFGGIFYRGTLTSPMVGMAFNNFAVQTITIFDFPALAFPVPAVLPPTAALKDVYFVGPNTRDSYSGQWSLSVQQEIAPQTVLQVAYVGNRGLRLQAGGAYGHVGLNRVNPLTGTRPLSGWGNEELLGNYLSSKYHALQVAMRRRAARLTFDANYTWSHQLDNTLDLLAEFSNPYNLNADWGNGDTDVRHVFTADAIYELPSPRSGGRVTKALLGGWQLGTILQARTGLTVDVVARPGVFLSTAPIRPNPVPGASFKAPNYSVPDTQLNPAAYVMPAAGQLGTLARNTARGPGFAQWDIALMKDTQLAERLRLQFRADFFNIVNHPNFNNPDNALCNAVSGGTCVPNANFGRSFSTVGSLVGIGTARQIQFALKLLF